MSLVVTRTTSTSQVSPLPSSRLDSSTTHRCFDHAEGKYADNSGEKKTFNGVLGGEVNVTRTSFRSPFHQAPGKLLKIFFGLYGSVTMSYVLQYKVILIR